MLKALEEVQYPGLVQLHVWHFPLQENIDASAGSLVRNTKCVCVCVVCVCMHMCVYMCAYACMHACVYGVCTCMSVCIVYVYVCMYVCVPVCVCSCVHVFVFVCILHNYTCVHTYITPIRHFIITSFLNVIGTLIIAEHLSTPYSIPHTVWFNSRTTQNFDKGNT